MKLPLYRKDLEEGIARRQAPFALADQLGLRQAAERQVAALIPALLASAFAGELVPQDPNDEPFRKVV